MKERITILIADDNPEFTATLTGYLEKEEEMEVIGIAKDGLEAYNMITNATPDIVLLDVIMPQLDGLGVLEKLNTSSCLLYTSSGNINVESLFLDDNYLTEVNRTLSGLTKLEQITLAQNKIENLQLPTTNLKLLNANHNALKEVPEINSHKLEILILDHNQISSKSANLERIKEMPLQVLALHNNQLTDISDLFNITGKPENIEREPIMNLQYLSLSGNKISDITALQKLIKLKELHLQDNKITSIEELKELPLSFLNVANNQIQDMTWAYKIPQLGTFNICLLYTSKTELLIIKQDANTKKLLQGAEFNLFDANKNIIHSNLVSNEIGEIRLANLLPGNYYLQETKAPGNYHVKEEWIPITLKLNESLKIIVENSQETETTVNTIHSVMNVQEQKQTTNLKLPKTGM